MFFATIEKIENDSSFLAIERAKKVYHMLYNEFKIPEIIPDISAVFKHIDYIVNLAGDDHVAIGSDYDGVPYSCKDLEDISKLGNLADYMAKRGYSEQRIQKIMGGNILRIINTVLK